MTALTFPVIDPAALADALKDRRLPGQRSKTAITRLGRERARRKEASPARPALADRARNRAVGLYTAEIIRRGGETEIEGWYGSARLKVTSHGNRPRLMVLHAEGYRDYGRDEGCHMASLSYLCGVDDSGRWAVRIPGTITNVSGALAWVIPAEVRRAQASGRYVRRQGDVHAIETAKERDTPTGWVGADEHRDPHTGDWVTSHYWNAQTRYLVHRPQDGRRHRPLRVPYPVRFVQQRTYQMGRIPARAATRAAGD